MGIGFEGAFTAPGIGTQLDTTEGMLWWGLRQQQKVVPVLLNGAARDAGNSPTDVLRPGVILGRNRTTLKVKEWDITAIDGTEEIYGVMLYDQKMTVNATSKDRYIGWCLIGGNLKADSLIYGPTAQTTPGLNNFPTSAAQELYARMQLTSKGRFILDDEPWGSSCGAWNRFVLTSAIVSGATPGLYTLVEADNNTFFIHDSAKAITLTLPVMRLGYHVMVYCTTDNVLIVATNPADTLVGFNDAVGSDVRSVSGNTIGLGLEFYGITGGKTLLVPHIGGVTDGLTAQKMTLTA